MVRPQTSDTETSMFKSLLKSLIGLAILVALLTGAWTLYLDPGILETSLDWKRVPQLGKQETAPVGIPEPLIATAKPGTSKSTAPDPAWARTPTTGAPATPAEAPPAVSPPPLAATEIPAAIPAPVTPSPQPEPTPVPAQTEAPVETTETPQTTVTPAPMPILIAKESAPTPSIPVEVATPAPMLATEAIEEPVIAPTPTLVPVAPAPAVPVATAAEPELMQPEPTATAAPIRGPTAIDGPQMVPGPALAVTRETPPASDTGPKATPAANAIAATQDTPVVAKASPMPSSIPEPSPAAEGTAAVEPVETAPETAAPAGEAKVTADADPLVWSTLMAARRAAWERRPGDAITLYRQLLEIDPDDFNAYGEMGNVLLHLRRPGEAAEAFKRAAGILIARDDFAGANRLLPVIWRLDPEAGRQLQAQISTYGRPVAPRE
ncbi:MAG: hypothetical protein DRQ37_06035 [Gammaproteobacteria bacterium]|nr:MAG: hypothetical protein DRQ37_06035 [Gammaproteobacteria bacterium]